MKKQILALVSTCLLGIVAGSAQTFVALRSTGFQPTNTIQIPTNTFAKFQGFYGPAFVSISHEGFSTAGVGQPTLGNGVLGPCVIVLRPVDPANLATNFISELVIELKTVNTTTPAMLVQPQGFNATATLQTSQDLVTWTMITNAVFSKSDSNRFFRTSLTLP